jgi:capsular polysaccharide transport system permease protein
MASHTTLLNPLRIQLRVVGALLMREIITRYGRQNIGFLWVFLEPMVFTLGVTALWYGSGLGHGSNLPIVAFAVTGYSSVLLWRNCATRSAMAVLPNIGLLYHRNVKVLDLFIARILLEIAGATISFVVLSTVWISLGWMELPNDILLVICGWLLLAWIGMALALIVGSLTVYTHVAELLWGPAAYILFPLSGAAFMVDWLPKKLQDTVLLLPMVHGVELLRDGYFGTIVHTHYDMSYAVSVCLAMTLIGLMLAKDAGRRVEMNS